MKVIDSKLLDLFREPGRCEFCGKPCPGGRDPAHIFSRGAGRVDIRENIVSLCRECHNNSHLGHAPKRTELLEIAARREKTTAEEIVDKVYQLRVDDKCKVWRVS